MPIFLILLRKIKKMGIHSKSFLAASAAKGLLRQPRGGVFKNTRRSSLATFNTSKIKDFIPGFEGLRRGR
jgi:hypothetical protein